MLRIVRCPRRCRPAGSKCHHKKQHNHFRGSKRAICHRFSIQTLLRPEQALTRRRFSTIIAINYSLSCITSPVLLYHTGYPPWFSKLLASAPSDTFQPIRFCVQSGLQGSRPTTISGFATSCQSPSKVYAPRFHNSASRVVHRRRAYILRDYSPNSEVGPTSTVMSRGH
jgi:hypothetical protein